MNIFVLGITGTAKWKMKLKEGRLLRRVLKAYRWEVTGPQDSRSEEQEGPCNKHGCLDLPSSPNLLMKSWFLLKYKCLIITVVEYFHVSPKEVKLPMKWELRLNVEMTSSGCTMSGVFLKMVLLVCVFVSKSSGLFQMYHTYK